MTAQIKCVYKKLCVWTANHFILPDVSFNLPLSKKTIRQTFFLLQISWKQAHLMTKVLYLMHMKHAVAFHNALQSILRSCHQCYGSRILGFCLKMQHWVLFRKSRCISHIFVSKMILIQVQKNMFYFVTVIVSRRLVMNFGWCRW